MAPDGRARVGSLVAKFEAPCHVADKGVTALGNKSGHPLSSAFASWWRRCQRAAEQRRVVHRRAASAPGQKLFVDGANHATAPYPTLIQRRPLKVQFGVKEVSSPCRSRKENSAFFVQKAVVQIQEEPLEKFEEEATQDISLEPLCAPRSPSSETPSFLLLRASAHYLQEEGHPQRTQSPSQPIHLHTQTYAMDENDKDEMVPNLDDNVLEASYDAIDILGAAMLFLSKAQDVDCFANLQDEEPEMRSQDAQLFLQEDTDDLAAEVILQGLWAASLSALKDSAEQRCCELAAALEQAQELARETCHERDEAVAKLQIQESSHAQRVALVASSGKEDPAPEQTQLLVAERDELAAKLELQEVAYQQLQSSCQERCGNMLKLQETAQRQSESVFEQLCQLSAQRDELASRLALQERQEFHVKQLCAERDGLAAQVKSSISSEQGRESALRMLAGRATEQERLRQLEEARCDGLQAELARVTAERDQLAKNDLTKLVDVKDITDAQKWLSTLKKERDDFKESLDWVFTRLRGLRSELSICKEKRRILHEHLTQEKQRSSRLQAELDKVAQREMDMYKAHHAAAVKSLQVAARCMADAE